MSKSKFSSFQKLYTDLKLDYPAIQPLLGGKLRSLDLEIRNIDKKRNTSEYLWVISIATLVIMWGAFIYERIWISVSVISTYLISNRKSFSVFESDLIYKVIPIGLFSIFCYLYLIPTTNKWVGSPLASTSLGPINMRSSKYVAYCVIVTYLALLFGLWFFSGTDVKYSEAIVFIVKILLFIPLFFFSVLSFMLLGGFLLKGNMKTLEEQIATHSRLYVCMLLMLLLIDLKQIRSYQLMNKESHDKILKLLFKISKTIKKYNIGNDTNIKIIGDAFDMNRAGNSFDIVILNFLTTTLNYEQNLKGSLVMYLNIFINGDIQQLPKSDAVIETVVKPQKVRFYHMVGLGIYLIFPIIAVMILKIQFNLKLDEYMQSLGRILYIVWVVVGLITSPVVNSDDNKEFIRDIMKALLGKG